MSTDTIRKLLCFFGLHDWRNHWTAPGWKACKHCDACRPFTIDETFNGQ